MARFGSLHCWVGADSIHQPPAGGGGQAQIRSSMPCCQLPAGRLSTVAGLWHRPRTLSTAELSFPLWPAAGIPLEEWPVMLNERGDRAWMTVRKARKIANI